MDGRTRLVFLAVAVAVLPASIFAQSDTVSGAKLPASVAAIQLSIVGDVERPQTYAFDAGTPVHVSELVAVAGMTEGGTAIVLRGSPLQTVSREYVDPTRPQPGQLLQPGDVVVFRSQSGLIPGQPNACVIFSKQRAVLPLKEGFLPAGDLLAQCRLQNLQQLVVTRSDLQSATTYRFSATDSIHHCDVIDLSWISLDDVVTNSVFAQAPAGDSVQSEYTGDTADGTTKSGAETAEELIISAFVPAEKLEIEAEGPFSQASLTRVSEIQPQPVPATGVSRESRVSAMVSETEAGGVMNSLFIAGLLFAMGLILVGWIRTRREQEFAGKVSESLGIAGREAGASKERAEIHSVGHDRDGLPDSDAGENTIDAARWFGTEAAVSDADTTEQGSTQQGGGVPEDWRELDALVNNSLPIEVKASALPQSSVELFGRPLGPQRLRVDAAHDEIAAPHMLKRRNTSSTREQQAYVHARASESKRSGTSAVHGTGPYRGDNRFDQALSYLDEQGDS